MYATYKPIQIKFNDTWERPGESVGITMNAMNTNNTNNTNVQSLTAAIAALTKVLEEAIDIAKEESTTATTGTTTTTTEVTATTETATTAVTTTPETTTATPETTTATETTATTETTTATADEEDNTEFKGSMIEQDPTADISALYNITEYALRHEGKNIESDRSPYAPKENKVGVIGDYQVFISKEVTTKDNNVAGSFFRLMIKDKSIVAPIMDFNIHLIDSRAKAFSSENTCRVEKMKEDHDLMRFLNIVEEISSVVMSKYSK